MQKDRKSSSHYFKNRRVDRRRTNANPLDLSKAVDVTKFSGYGAVDRDVSNVKHNKVFAKEWGGIIASDRPNLNNKEIEFKASFDRPLEQLMYPSLQLVDKKISESEEYKKLHGHYDYQSSSRFDAHFPLPKSNSNAMSITSAVSTTNKQVFSLAQPVKLLCNDSISAKKVVHGLKWSASLKSIQFDDPDEAADMQFENSLNKGEEYIKSQLRKSANALKQDNQEMEKIRKETELAGLQFKRKARTSAYFNALRNTSTLFAMCGSKDSAESLVGHFYVHTDNI